MPFLHLTPKTVLHPFDSFTTDQFIEGNIIILIVTSCTEHLMSSVRPSHSNSHHQDYYMFSRESLNVKLHLPLLLGRSNWYQTTIHRCWMGTLRPFLVLSTGHGIGIASHLFNRKNGHQERSIQGPPLLLRPLVWTEVDWTSKSQAQTYLWLKTWSKPWQSVLHVWATKKKRQSQ